MIDSLLTRTPPDPDPSQAWRIAWGGGGAGIYDAAILTAAALRSSLQAAWPSSRTSEVFVRPAFSSKRDSEIGETKSLPNACEPRTAAAGIDFEIRR